MEIILHSDDINLLSYWEKSMNVKYSVSYDLDDLMKVKDKIIIINYSALNKESNTILSFLNDNFNYVLVLDRTPNINKGKKVLSFGAKGYGNALMKDHFLYSAINTMKEKMIWLYPEFTSELISLLPLNPNKTSMDLLANLSPREKEVTQLLNEAFTYKDIAKNLDITPRTVKAHAQNIYKKLDTKNRLELALLLK